MTHIVDELPLVSEAQCAEILAAPRTAEAHDAFLRDIPAMTSLECGGMAQVMSLPKKFVTAAWNLERCLFPEDSAAHLACHAPQVVLLSEMDCGMARTAQRNTTADMARELGMTYAFGVEFFEMGLGGETEREFCTHDYNQAGWHGNAILSAAPFEKVALFRLSGQGHWYITGEGGAGDPGQPRIGGRMAVAATVPTANGHVCFVSTHLESNASNVLRGKQYGDLLDAVEAFAPNLPVVIGGDLNTGNHMPPDFDWRREDLFQAAEDRGYSWALNPDGFTTRPSLISPHPSRQMKLDWFCVRGVAGRAMPILASLDPTGRPLSDHDCMLCEIILDI